MRTLLVGTTAIALLGGGSAVALAGTSTGQGAQKTGLYAQSGDLSSSCKTYDGTAPTASGFVILNAPGQVGAVQKIVGEVALKKAAPNSTFAVFLAQNGTCTPTGTLSTNGVGNGNSHLDAAGSGGSYYVVLQDLGGKERYATAPVTLQ